MREVRFTIEGRLPGLNEMLDAARRNRYTAANQKRKLTRLCADACENAEPLTGPVDVTIYWHERDYRRDADNLTAAQKFILDGLVVAGVIPNDNRRTIPQPPRHVVVVDKQRPRVCVVVKEIE